MQLDLSERRRLGRGAQAAALCLVVGLVALTALAGAATAAGRHASMAIDANTGRVLHEQAADEPRYPASLTKMMTLYIVFELMEQGRLTPSTRIRISEEAADASPSKLGIPEGGEIALMDAVKAIIVKSANDISVAVAEHIAGSEEKFAALMTRKARQLGMTRTTFRNPHGLPDPGQQTTARDMLTLAMRLADDFPRQYRLFSSRSFEWNGASHRNHNTMLASYDGMDGIKTGYISASGFNLVASVRRDGKHVVAVVFGGSSAAARNVYMRAILDRALVRASTERTRERVPRPEVVARERRPRPAVAEAAAPQLVEPVRPAARRTAQPAEARAASAPAREYRAGETADEKAEVAGRGKAPSRTRPVVVAPRAQAQRSTGGDTRMAVAPAAGTGDAAPRPLAVATPPPPAPMALPAAPARAPSSLQAQADRIERGEPAAAGLVAAAPADMTGRMGAFAVPSLAQRPPRAEPAPAAGPARPARPAGGSGASGVTIQVGAYTSEAEAERRLAAARDRAGGHLAGARTRTQAVQSGERQLWRARFVGLDERTAAAACSDLKRQQVDCQVVRD